MIAKTYQNCDQKNYDNLWQKFAPKHIVAKVCAKAKKASSACESGDGQPCERTLLFIYYLFIILYHLHVRVVGGSLVRGHVTSFPHSLIALLSDYHNLDFIVCFHNFICDCVLLIFMLI